MSVSIPADLTRCQEEKIICKVVGTGKVNRLERCANPPVVVCTDPDERPENTKNEWSNRATSMCLECFRAFMSTDKGWEVKIESVETYEGG